MTARAFDHLVLTSKDLTAHADFFTRLGFTLTPRGRHPWGTVNHLAQMQGVFIELLGIDGLTGVAEHSEEIFSFPAFTRDFLATRQGMSMLVFQTRDAAAVREEWRTRGLKSWELFKFHRQAPQPDGTSVPVAFTLAWATHPGMPQAGFFVCQQHYPENFWRPRFQQHHNHAAGIPTVWMVGRDPADYADFFARLVGENSVRAQGRELRVACGVGELVMLDPAGYANRFPGLHWADDGSEPRFAGFAVAADLEACRRHMEDASIPFREEGGALRLDPAQAFGSVIVFVQS